MPDNTLRTHIRASRRLYRRGNLQLERWREDNQPKYCRAQFEASGAAFTPENTVFFWGHQPSKDGRITASCLSQWFIADFHVGGTPYICMEQFMMASKARLFEDEETLVRILKSSDPKEIKALGRQVKGFDEAVWNEAKHLIILNGNFCKFTQNPALQAYLLASGERTLVEASPYDTIWGVGLAAEDPRIQDPRQWRGENLLGFALMEVRDEIRRTLDDKQAQRT